MPTLRSKYKVPHFDGKGESNHFFTDAGVPTTFLLTSFYWDNFVHLGMGPKRGPDGKLAITFPMDDKKLPGIAAEDIGKCAYGIFKRGAEFIGKTVAISGENLTGAEMAVVFTEVLGKEVRYNNVSPEVYRGFGFPGADDLGNMFQFKRDFEGYFSGVRNPSFARATTSPITNLKQNPQWIYEQVYCQRGDIENRIKELHDGMQIGRTSCSNFWANTFRVLLTAAAYVLMQEMRLRLARTRHTRAQVATLREHFLKLGAQVVVSVRRIVPHANYLPPSPSIVHSERCS